MSARLATMVFGLSLAVLGGVIVFRATSDEPLSQPAARQEPKAPDTLAIGGAFTLTDHNGNRVSSSALAGSAFMLGFGYTSCPDVCPTMLQTMTAVMDGLTEQEKAQFRPVFVSVDGARDTPEVLKAYLGHFHPSILGLTGTKEDVASAAKAYKVYYKVHDADSAGNYMVDHGGSLYLMGKDGTFIKSFSHALDPALIVAGVREVLAR